MSCLMRSSVLRSEAGCASSAMSAPRWALVVLPSHAMLRDRTPYRPPAPAEPESRLAAA
jgi:hypothetical protein